jgi:hypothetical protein
VHDEGCVQQLERGTHVGRGLEVGAAEGLVRAHDHAGPETLAAHGVGLEGLPQRDVLHAEGSGAVLG